MRRLQKNYKFLNAINILAEGQPDALFRINEAFGGDFERAWSCDITKFLHRQKGVLLSDLHKKQKSIDAERQWKRIERDKVDIITVLDKDYPSSLENIPNPPFMLYVRGAHALLAKDCLGVVGTRNLTDYGRRVAQDIVSDLAQSMVIVSGLAYGIDAEAHKAALEAGGETIAVLPNYVGDGSIQPRAHQGLAESIIKSGGVLVSEFPFGYKTQRFSFSQRNRIISGLSRGVLVIEGGLKSGTMITARCALEQGRDVFAVPGSIYSHASRGAHWLLQNGAKPVVCAQDVLEDYGYGVNDVQSITADNDYEQAILDALKLKPCTQDEIIRRTGLGAQTINATLSIMEVSRKIKTIGNGVYVLYSN